MQQLSQSECQRYYKHKQKSRKAYKHYADVLARANETNNSKAHERKRPCVVVNGLGTQQ
ncbi:hypothetical protein K523DRAFT_325399 [Schizophyllum commune Tattone D]|nr:hypothetical protein K523DRAFT_325399 [Schizophyllum commune Tattone D]